MSRVIAALFGVAVGFALLVIWLELGRQSGATGWAATGVFFGLLALGYPMLYFCCKRGWWACWRFILLGAFWGLLAALPFFAGPPSVGFGFLLAIFLLAGAGLGLLFWLVAIWRNDSLTCPKAFCLPCGIAYKVARNALRRRDLV